MPWCNSYSLIARQRSCNQRVDCLLDVCHLFFRSICLKYLVIFSWPPKVIMVLREKKRDLTALKEHSNTEKNLRKHRLTHTMLKKSMLLKEQNKKTIHFEETVVLSTKKL